MKSLFEMSRTLWIEGQLRSPAWAQATIIPCLQNVKELVRLRPYLTVHRMHGQNPGGPLTVDYVGLNCVPIPIENLYTDYRPTLIRELFTEEEPTIKEIGRVAVWQTNTLTELPDNDLVVFLGSKHLIRKLPRQNVIVLPLFVRMVMNVQGDWQDVTSRIHKKLRRSEFGLVRKYGYEYELSRNPEDFELFYYKMYRPLIKKRHKDLVSPMPFKEAHQNFKNGYLHLIKRDGRHVAGGLSYAQGRIVIWQLLGVIDAEEELIREGALGACYYALLHWANREGYTGVSFEECASHLDDGLFQHKRRWGATVTYSDESHQQIWIRIQRDTPAVRQFFKDNPFITINKHRQLQGLIVTDDPDSITEETQMKWNKWYATPGLDGLLVRSVADLCKHPL